MITPTALQISSAHHHFKNYIAQPCRKNPTRPNADTRQSSAEGRAVRTH